ncbi:MAG: hypothetical protein M1816_002537 [Peltula sp. TS41687]|nr:MAG: hypothetical protein M1816_002537 [Peltula sp. TS41687]
MDNTFLPPNTPPPPQVPEGWKAIWNEQYHEWFYVNLHTKQSQWDKPASPAQPIHPDTHGAPQGPPPAYETAQAAGAGINAKPNPYDTTNPQLTQQQQSSTPIPIGTDQSQQEQQQQQRGGKSHGLLGKLFSAATKAASSSRHSGYPGQSPYSQQGYNNSFPPHRYSVDPYSARYGGGYGGGYGMYPPPRRHGGGLGMGGGAALGLGGGLLGGAMLGNAMGGGMGHGGGYGGGYGGGSGSSSDAGGGSDYGGGDGGDFGGGDFGGGDFGGF